MDTEHVLPVHTVLSLFKEIIQFNLVYKNEIISPSSNLSKVKIIFF